MADKNSQPGKKRNKIRMFFWLTVLIFAGVFTWLLTLGFFNKLPLTVGELDSLVLVYEAHQGDYGQTGIIIDKLYSALNKDKIKTHRTFGLYYDDPQKVRKAFLRSRVGCILESQDYEWIPQLSAKYTLMKLEPAKVVSITLPYKNMASIFIGTARAYPELRKYAAEHGYHPEYSLEIYDRQNKNMVYILNISK